MDNPTLARLLTETGDLLEISGGDPFRIRSYRRAADAAEQSTVDLAAIADDLPRLLEVPGIGKGMAANIQAAVATGSIPLRDELLTRYSAGILDLLKLPGMGPKTVALLWDAAKISSIDQLAEAIDAGRLAGLPRMGEKQIEKLRKGIEDFRKSAGRFRIDEAEESAERVIQYLLAFDGIERVTPAGSLRRGRETAGDLDLLVTGPACEPDKAAAAVEYTAAYPGIRDMIAKGENKVSFYLSNSLQVDVRLLPSASYGAALQYFTGSKMHNVSLRQRALKMGYTLSEWALARLEDGPKAQPAPWSPPRLKKPSTPRSAWTGCRPSCAKTWARSKPRRVISYLASSNNPTSVATSTCTPTPPTAITPFAKWPMQPSSAATSTSPSPTTPKTSP
jgi:DNA polymerase (family 10)